MDNSFNKYFLEKKDIIDKALLGVLPKDNRLISKAMRYGVLNGGKRIRSILVLAAAEASGASYKNILEIALAIEIIHCSSLIHDDLPAMDNDDYRRGKLACHKKFGEDIAILAGDALLMYAFEILANNFQKYQIKSERSAKIMALLCEAIGSRGVILGQVLDMKSENKKISLKRLKEIHSLKTGKLMQVAVRIGAEALKLNTKQIKGLEKYALHFGLIYQIVDDILDEIGTKKELGKMPGSDKKKNKSTYISVCGLKKAIKLAEKEAEKAIESLKVFGPKAERLRQLIFFIKGRSS
ncbi:MAG: polyprenyl synthetase family protein [Candidatus Saganbacteria bacterium]|nr:polyprenyl synthetase family protein [Candidatus Saganbacteria bacterium]